MALAWQRKYGRMMLLNSRRVYLDARRLCLWLSAWIVPALICSLSTFCHAQSGIIPKPKSAQQVLSKKSSVKTDKAVSETNKKTSQPVDAVIFVRPLYPDGANIGIAYSAQVPHATAEVDVRRLLAVGKWQQAGPLRISDESVHPDRLKEYVVATGVFVNVYHAPQVIDNAPVLLPYLKAFQRLRRFELNFELDGLHPYRGVTKVDNAALSVQMVQGLGLTTFQITIHNHKGSIPELVNSGAAIDQTRIAETQITAAGSGAENYVGASRKLHPRRPNMLLIVTLALGAGTVTGGSIYWIMSRHASR